MTKKKVTKKKKIGASTVVIAVLSVLLTTMLVLNLTGAWFTDREHRQTTLQFGAIELEDLEKEVFIIGEPRRDPAILMPGHTLEANFEIAIPADVVNIQNAFVRSCIKVTFDGDETTGDPEEEPNKALTGRLGEIAAAMGAAEVYVENFNPYATRQQYVKKVVMENGAMYELEGVNSYIGAGGENTGSANPNAQISSTNIVVVKKYTAADGTVTDNLQLKTRDDKDETSPHAAATLIIERFNMIYAFKYDFNQNIANKFEDYVAWVDTDGDGDKEAVPKWETAVDQAGTYWNYYYRELKPGETIVMDYKYEIVGYKVGNALQQVQIWFDLEVQAVQAENLGWDNTFVSYDPSHENNAGGDVDHDNNVEEPKSTYWTSMVYSGDDYAGAANPAAAKFRDQFPAPIDDYQGSETNPRNASNAIIAFAQVLGITDGYVTGADVEGAYKPVVNAPVAPEGGEEG